MRRHCSDLMPHPESDAIDGITYDRFGRMMYHPDFHFAQGKPMSEEDLEYLCMFYEVDDVRSLSYALGKTDHIIRAKYMKLKKQGRVEYYKKRYRERLEE